MMKKKYSSSARQRTKFKVGKAMPSMKLVAQMIRKTMNRNIETKRSVSTGTDGVESGITVS